MRSKTLAVLFVCGQAWLPGFGQLVGDVDPAAGYALNGKMTTVAIDIDLGSGGATLGSYGSTLSWDSAVLQFIGVTGGTPPFDDPVVNTSRVSSGLLRFADAAPVGAQGRVNVLNVTFLAIADPPAVTVLDLEFTSLFDAGDFADLQPQLTVEDGTACVADFSYDLRLTGGTDTILDWSGIPGAGSYDVIKGNLAELADGGTSISLGPVECLENDSLDTTTDAGTEPRNPDFDIPLPGQGFYYLVRFHDGGQNATYGWFRDCLKERQATGGDCP